MTPHQLPDAADDQVVGAGLGVHSLLARLAERRAHAVDEEEVAHGAGLTGLTACGHGRSWRTSGRAARQCYSSVTKTASRSHPPGDVRRPGCRACAAPG